VGPKPIFKIVSITFKDVYSLLGDQGHNVTDKYFLWLNSPRGPGPQDLAEILQSHSDTPHSVGLL
jgi:hypothetical protein